MCGPPGGGGQILIVLDGGGFDGGTGRTGITIRFLVSSVDSRSELHSHLPDDLTLEDVAEDVLLHILVGKVGYLQ